MAVHLPLFSGLLLSDRFQCTSFKGTLSGSLPVSIGVPQGIILCPQSSSTIHGLNARLNRDASGVFAWANSTRLKLNLITTEQKFRGLNDHSLHIMINGKLI